MEVLQRKECSGAAVILPLSRFGAGEGKGEGSDSSAAAKSMQTCVAASAKRVAQARRCRGRLQLRLMTAPRGANILVESVDGALVFHRPARARHAPDVRYS